MRLRGGGVGGEIPAARFLDIPERLFTPKRFQRHDGVAGFCRSLRNRYRDGGYHLIFFPSFFLGKSRGGVACIVFFRSTHP